MLKIKSIEIFAIMSCVFVTGIVLRFLEVSEAATSEESLEDYFKRVTGGEGIA